MRDLELTVCRMDCNKERTIGGLYVNGKFFCYTLEDSVHDGPKIPGRTAIPSGTYQVIITESQKFGKELPLLLKVPGFDGIRIHSGNDAMDTEGCIIVGMDRNIDQVLRSRDAMAELQPVIQKYLDEGRKVWIRII